MTNDQIIALLQKWQLDGQTKSRGVFVNFYGLHPQAAGFMLTLELHVDGAFENEEKVAAFGETLSQTFENAIAIIKLKKDALRKALDE